MKQNKKNIQKIKINTEMIQLDQLLKWGNVLSTGGQIKGLLENEEIYVNGEVCTAKRKQLHHGDVVDIKKLGTYLVVYEKES